MVKSVPHPYIMFGYEIRPEAVVGDIANSSAKIVMYTDGPSNAEFPRKEYSEQMIKIVFFFQFGHWRLCTLSASSLVPRSSNTHGSLGSLAGAGKSACP